MRLPHAFAKVPGTSEELDAVEVPCRIGSNQGDENEDRDNALNGQAHEAHEVELARRQVVAPDLQAIVNRWRRGLPLLVLLWSARSRAFATTQHQRPVDGLRPGICKMACD